MQKVKRHTSTVTKIVYIPTYTQNGNGTHAANQWRPGDPPEKHPLFDLAGKYKDDPLFEESVQLMKKLRQEELEQDWKRLDEEEAERKAKAE